MNKALGILIFTSFFILHRSVFAVEAAPHISDREIVESLTVIRGDIKRLEDGQKAMDKGLNTRIDDLRSEMNGKFADLRSEIKGDIRALEEGQKALDKGLNKRIDDLRSEMNGRFDALQWMFGIFVTIALVILGFVLRMQWQMHRRQTRMETVLETQREELGFIRGFMEKFFPPRGVL